jgi:Zn-dependent protease with chaperone function
VKLSEGQLPDVWRLYEKAATRLAISKLPDLFLYQSPVPQAYLLGVDEPVLALSSGLLDLLEEDELLGVMGHELTHWACQHALYRTAAVLLATVGGGIIGSLAPVGRAVLTPIRMALLEWMRSSELTADRGELIVTGSLDCSIRTLLKLSGGTVRYGQLSVDAFLEQAEMVEDEQEKSFVGRAMTFWIGMQATHPFAVWRAHHLKRFAHSQEFFEILAGRYRRLLPE